MEHAEPHLKWAMEVCFNLGTRPGESELLSLKWDDCRLRCWYRQDLCEQRPRPIGRSRSTLSFLKRMEAEKRNRCPGMSSSTWAEADDNSEVLQECLSAGRDHLSDQDVRPAAPVCDHLAQQGGDLAAVSKMMGHSTVKLTADTYYHYMEGEKERAVRLLPGLAVA